MARKCDKCPNCEFRIKVWGAYAYNKGYACDYMNIMKKKRPCPAENCKVFEPYTGKYTPPEAETPIKTAKKMAIHIDDNKAMSLYNAGLNDGQMGLKMGISKCTVRKWRIGKELPPNCTRQRSCSAIDCNAARNMYLQGLNDRQIAEELGCAETTVCAWRKREGRLAQSKRVVAV